MQNKDGKPPMTCRVCAAIVLLLMFVGLFASAIWFRDEKVYQPHKGSHTAAYTETPPADSDSAWKPADIINAWIAGFTGVLAVSTILLWFATMKAANGALRGAVAAEKALIDLERPYIFVTDVLKIILENEQQWIPYAIANYGKTPANIEVVYTKAATTNHGYPLNPVETVYNGGLEMIPILAANQKRDDFKISPPLSVRFDGEYAWYPQGYDFFFWVIVRYRGPFSKGHESSFCWRYDRPLGCFIPFGGEAYNYTH